MAKHSDGSHVLYRFYSATGQLLYVGITMNPVQRFRSHRGTKDWWVEVVGITIEHYKTRDDLANAERRAIQVERPQHNVVHTKKKPLRFDVRPETAPSEPEPPQLNDEELKGLFTPASSNILDSLFSGLAQRWTCYGYITDEQYEKYAAVDRAKREAVEACPFCDELGYRNMYVCNHVDNEAYARKAAQRRLQVIPGGDA